MLLPTSIFDISLTICKVSPYCVHFLSLCVYLLSWQNMILETNWYSALEESTFIRHLSLSGQDLLKNILPSSCLIYFAGVSLRQEIKRAIWKLVLSYLLMLAGFLTNCKHKL